MQTLALQSKLWRDFFSAMAESWKNLKDKQLFHRFLCGSALVRELLSNNSLFVGQLQADKSLELRARDLISFTTDLQTVNFYSTIHSWSIS